MGAASWAIPVGVLGGLCAAMLIFFFWYFPRIWTKGTQADFDRMDAERAERAIALQQRAAMQDGEGQDASIVVMEGVQPPKPKPVFKYEPPMY